MLSGIRMVLSGGEYWSAVRPGDRYSHDCVVVDNSSGNADRHTAAYRPREGCQACELIGTASIAFDFGTSGAFVGAIARASPGALIGTRPPGFFSFHFSEPGKCI
ncbi:MAG TPA: hypothetical protein VN328_09175 [Thermodesulfovibrionales bacterium]|nr:hypothetical protein [Thermodesulfovibrionales bacterium]